MINLAPIPKKIQKRMFEKMNALGNYETRDPFSVNSNSALTMDKMMTRSTYIRMVSGQANAVILMGGKLKTDSSMPSTYNDIYGTREYKVGGLADTPELEELKKIMIRSGDYTDDEITKRTSPTGGILETLSNSNNRPMPGIKSIDVTFKGGQRALREATINWTCWSFQELDYLMPHFLSHGKTVMIEWGWVYDKQPFGSDAFLEQDSLGNRFIKTDTFTSPVNKVIDKNGDLDMMTGIIKNFEFSTREDGAFDCQTIVSSVGVSLIDNVMPNYGSLDLAETFNLNLNEDTKEVTEKLREATGKNTAIDSDFTKKNPNKPTEKDRLIDLNTTVTLKAFLAQINDYVADKLSDDKEKILPQYKKNEKPTGGGSDTFFNYIPNQFIVEYRTTGSLGFVEKILNVWVRWGWFEDNILSKFLSMTSVESDNKIINEFRSIENQLDKEGNPTNKYESVRIRNHEFLETVNIGSYILPGQFIPMKKRKEGDVFYQEPKIPSEVKPDEKAANVSSDESISKAQPPKYNPKDRDLYLKEAIALNLYKWNRFGNSVLNPTGVDILASTIDTNILTAIIEHDDLPSGDLVKVRNRLVAVNKAQRLADANNVPLDVEQVNTIAEKKKIAKFPVDLPGDDDYIQNLGTLVNQSDLFPTFTTESDLIQTEGPTEKSVHSESMMKRVRKYKDKNWAPEKKDKKFMACWNDWDNWKDGKIGKDTINTEVPKPGKYGYLRNMLINTSVIKEAFGVSTDGSYGVESINIIESLQTMFDLINQEFPFWNFTVTTDTLEDNRVKIIDDNISQFDFNMPTDLQATKFVNGDVVKDGVRGEVGVFFFPTWQHNSIVKSQNITANLPSSMAMATMYGGNMNQLKDFSNPGSQFSDAAGVIAGGLYNNSKDNSKNNIDIAFRNKESRNIGNSSGDENEPLTLKGGDDIFTSLNTDSLEEKYNTRLSKINKNIRVAVNKKKEKEARLMFDDAVPPPLVSQLNTEQLSALLIGEEEVDEDEFRKLYSQKYVDGKLKKKFVQSISFLTTNHGKYANVSLPVMIPLDLELDVDGIGGIYPGNSFHSSYLPSRYKASTVFQAFDVSHKVDNSGWTTSIGGKMRATKGGVFIGLKTLAETQKEMYKNMIIKAELNIKDSLKVKQQKKNELVEERMVESGYYERDNIPF